MRPLIGFVLMLTLQGTVFAQTAAAATVQPEPSVYSTIDHLNDISFNIYLESPDSARKVAEKALLMSEKAKYATGIGHSFLNIGHVYWSQSYYPIALFYASKALGAFPKNKPLDISSCYNLLGRIYADLKDYKTALAELDSSESYAGRNADRLAETYSERSLVYKRIGMYDDAIENAAKALALTHVAHDEANAAVLYGRLSGIYRLRNQFSAAITYSDTALAESYITHNKRLRATTYVEYADIYRQMGKYDKAVYFAQRGAALGDSIGVVDAISSAYQSLIGCYEEKHDLVRAMYFQKKYNSILDSLNTFNNVKNTTLIQDYFVLNSRLNDMAAAEHNAAEVREKVKMQRLTIVILSFSLAFVVILLSVTYYFYKQKKRIGQKLNMQNEALTGQKQVIEAQAENLETLSKVKDKLLAVIAHDLRTPLANLRNIADMFDTDYLSKEEVHWLMKDINPMVRSAELTLSNLLEWAGNQIKGRSVNSSQLDIFLLGVEMEQTFTHALQKKNIEFSNQASPGRSVLADENHIKVVLRNLISNAIKFTDNNGCVILKSEYEDSKVVISVQDNGKGMSQDEIGKLFSANTHFSQRGTLGENGMGIGLMLCKELIELNGGKLWIISSPGEGSTFSFSLPLNREYA
ncbi:MAG: tetratricopeptide repeat-containing sensor histidine kinase [Bacteroidetes bacterium]|nr:tetratricopeptide repeat-containing sensor histidine kinase [Bacteroidota bacterium]